MHVKWFDFIATGKHLTVFSLKIMHGGAFTSPPNCRYRGGKVNWFDDIDSDSFYVIEVSSMQEELGYVNEGMLFIIKYLMLI